METEIKIKGVIFARSWWTAAKEELSSEDRLQFYEAVMQYAFDDAAAAELSAPVRAMFAMVKPFLDDDKVKYQERVLRNRENAQGRKRVAPSGSQSLPVATNNNTNSSTNTNTNTNNNTNTISLDVQREKWIIFGYFWATGSKALGQELAAFWDYYDALGWKNNKGAPIVNKLAAARMWRRQFETGDPPFGAPEWWEIMKGCPVPDPLVFSGYRGAEILEDHVLVHMAVNETWLESFKDKCSGLLTMFAKVARKPECRLTVF